MLHLEFECSVDPLTWRAAIEDIKNEELNKRL
jgi:hypothetical protein